MEHEDEPGSSEPLWQTNDSVHGSIGIPAFLKNIIDTQIFQRMREIKQTGLLEYVYFGATHTRFAHSIGTCFMAYKLLKRIQQDQPGKVQSKDILCICMAALLHDIGHPAFSHTFEVFMQESGEPGTTHWSHEDASKLLCKEVFKQLDGKLRGAGLGDRDLEFVIEMIDPPKKQMIAALKENKLHEKWGKLIKGRDFKDAWMYEVVSNWRSGMDVDRFDYFVRDSKHCGLVPTFDHERYLMHVKLTFYNPENPKAAANDPRNIWTLASQLKDADTWKRAFFEQRREYHRMAYQHKTVKKMEVHMIGILQKMAPRFTVENAQGENKSLYAAADLREDKFDWTAYVQITDELVRTKLKEMKDLHAEYKFHILERNLMRNCADFENEESTWPTVDEQDQFVKAVQAETISAPMNQICPVREDFSIDDLQSHMKIVRTTLHEGSGESNPMEFVLLLDPKNPAVEQRKVLAKDITDNWQRIADAIDKEHEHIVSKIRRMKYCRRRIHVFWNPPLRKDERTGNLSKKFSHATEEVIVKRVCLATQLCVDRLSSTPSGAAGPASPVTERHLRGAFTQATPRKLEIYNADLSPARLKRRRDPAADGGGDENDAATAPKKKRRVLQVNSSHAPTEEEARELHRLRSVGTTNGALN